MPRSGKRLVPVRLACELDACPDCGSPWCKEHNKHYSECPCWGPDHAVAQGYTLIWIKGQLYGVLRPATEGAG